MIWKSNYGIHITLRGRSCFSQRFGSEYNVLIQYTQNQTVFAWEAALRLLRSLKANRSVGLSYKLQDEKELTSYCDSDFVSDPSNRISRSGFVLQYGQYTFDWRNKKQSTCSPNTAEAEYHALSESMKEIR